MPSDNVFEWNIKKLFYFEITGDGTSILTDITTTIRITKVANDTEKLSALFYNVIKSNENGGKRFT